MRTAPHRQLAATRGERAAMVRRYTVKRYHSVKQTTEDVWQHQTIQLQPLNKDYQPIETSSEETDDIRVVGELICVIEPTEQ